MVIWIDKAVVLALHGEQIAEHGGQDGVRDEGLLDSALARPQNLQTYGTSPDIFDLAAAYGFGIARNHAFVDGNKRASLVVTETFLYLNGVSIAAGDIEIIGVWLSLADGSLSEADLAQWLRARAEFAEAVDDEIKAG